MACCRPLRKQKLVPQKITYLQEMRSFKSNTFYLKCFSTKCYIIDMLTCMPLRIYLYITFQIEVSKLISKARESEISFLIAFLRHCINLVKFMKCKLCDGYLIIFWQIDAKMGEIDGKQYFATFCSFSAVLLCKYTCIFETNFSTKIIKSTCSKVAGMSPKISRNCTSLQSFFVNFFKIFLEILKFSPHFEGRKTAKTEKYITKKKIKKCFCSINARTS